MKRLALIIVIIVAAQVSAAQQLYVPTPGTQNIVSLSLQPGTAYLFVDAELPPITLMIASTDLLFAEPDAAKGQAAVDSCVTTGVPPPIQSVLGIGEASCENQRRLAINADVAVRVKVALTSIPDSVLAANKLRRVQ